MYSISFWHTNNQEFCSSSHCSASEAALHRATPELMMLSLNVLSFTATSFMQTLDCISHVQSLGQFLYFGFSLDGVTSSLSDLTVQPLEFNPIVYVSLGEKTNKQKKHLKKKSYYKHCFSASKSIHSFKHTLHQVYIHAHYIQWICRRCRLLNEFN